MARTIYILILIGIFSCGHQKSQEISDIILDIEKEYSPDKRTAIFRIEASGENPVVLKGETNLTEAKTELLNRLKSAGVSTIDEITILPGKHIGNQHYGIINVSVANLRANPTHSAELATQALLGTPVNILKAYNGWLLVQTPDKYIAWTNKSSLVLNDERQLNTWKNARKIIYLNTTGFAMETSGVDRVSDLVAGNVLLLDGENKDYWSVTYPDARKAIVHKNEAEDLNNWLANIGLSDSSIVSAARSLMGVPYLWGGTSTKSLDCSGFTKTVYFLNGLILPRDASQQVHAGELIDTEKDFSQLAIGDLLFFGRINEDQSEKVIHVGLWLGNNQFIHSSTDVHISSMDSLDENFDKYNFDRYLRTKRIKESSSTLVENISELY